MKYALLALGIVLFAIHSSTEARGEEPQMESAVCTFEDGKEMSIQYNGQAGESDKLSIGQVWPRATHPMFLFTQTPLKIENTSIPAGAFSVYVIPDKKHWTLVVNRNVASGDYRPQEDLVRASMETGEVNGGEAQPKISLGRNGPKRCEFRFYSGKTGAFVEFQEE